MFCTCSSFSTFSLRPLRRLLWAFRAVSGGVTSGLADSGLALAPVIHAAVHLRCMQQGTTSHICALRWSLRLQPDSSVHVSKRKHRVAREGTPVL